MTLQGFAGRLGLLLLLAASCPAPPKLKGDALMLMKTEAASSLIYWTGTQYRWYQQGD